MQTVLSLQLGVWVTKSQQEYDSAKALEGSSNERIGTHCGEQLGVKDKDLKTIDVEVVKEIRVEEAVNLQQKMQDKKGFLNYHQRISILDSKYHRN